MGLGMSYVHRHTGPGREGKKLCFAIGKYRLLPFWRRLPWCRRARPKGAAWYLYEEVTATTGLVGAAILRLRSGSQHRRRQDRYPIEGCLGLRGWWLRGSGRKTQEISPGTGKPRYRAARSEGARFPSGTRPRDPGQDRGNKHGATWSIISLHKLRVGLLPPAWPGSHSEVIFETVFRSDGKERQEN